MLQAEEGEPVARILVIGNAGGGKSTLARKLAASRGLRYFELDSIVWRANWEPVPQAIYEAEHARLIAGENWVIDGLGWSESLPARFARATEIILVDMPIWMHFWLAAERQWKWLQGDLEHGIAGIAEPPSTEGMFRTLWETDRDMMPAIRALTDAAAAEGKAVVRIDSVEALTNFGRA